MNFSAISGFSRSLEIFFSLLTFFCVSYGCSKQGFYPYMIQVKRKKGGKPRFKTEDSNVNVTLKHANRKSC